MSEQKVGRVRCIEKVRALWPVEARKLPGLLRGASENSPLSGPGSKRALYLQEEPPGALLAEVDGEGQGGPHPSARAQR